MITLLRIKQRKGYTSLWLETDTQLVWLALKSFVSVPWTLRNRWLNCLVFVGNINLNLSHVYRERNACADGLANIGISSPPNTFVWFNTIPDNIRGGVH
jgi:hypothetical protein